jgi:hypothetical protein
VTSSFSSFPRSQVALGNAVALAVALPSSVRDWVLACGAGGCCVAGAAWVAK